MRKDVVWCAAILIFSFLVSACSQTTIPTVPTSRFIAWSQAERATQKRVCVLPFVDSTDVPGMANKVRQSFAGHLSVKHFVDAELHDVDARLETFGPGWQSASAQELGRALRCQALVYGQVTRARRLYLALYSQLTLEGRILLVDAETGQNLVKDSHATKFRSAGFPLSPLSIVPDAIKNLSNLSETQMVRAIDDLGRNLANKVPDLPVSPRSRMVATALPPSRTNPSSTGHLLAEPLPEAEKGPSRQSTVAQLESSASDAPQMRAASLSEENTQTLPSTGVAPTPTQSQDEGYRLQVAALRTPAKAEHVVLLLRSKGYEPVVMPSVGTVPVWHRVVLGPFPSIHEAQTVGTQINKDLRLSPIVINSSQQ